MTDRNRRRLAIGLLLLVATGLMWWWLTDEPVVTGVEPAASIPNAQRPAHEEARGEAAPRLSGSGSPTVSLPPSGSPLAESLGPLQALADAGSSQAACRLAIELLRCAHLESTKSMRTPDGRPLDVIAAESGNLEHANRLGQMDIRRIELMQQCATVDPALLAAAPRYLAAAARAGEPEAMLRYATRAQDGGSFSSAFARDPDFARWRLEAPAMLMRALEAGRPEAVELLASAHRHDANPLSALFGNDPVQERAYQLLAARLRSRIASQSALEQASEETRAQQLASDWHGRYFDNRSFSQEQFPHFLPSLDMPMHAPQDERFCERPPG